MELLKTLSGWKDTSETDSNMRRAGSRVSIAIAVLLFVEAALLRTGGTIGLALIGYFALLWSVVFFSIVVFLQPLRSSSTFQINAQRLLLDTMVLALMMIMAFAVLYRLHGLNPPSHLGRDIVALDSVYFSAVNFSTPGFGDFAPIGWSKLFAASEALIGNIHLGFVVGSIFAIVGRVFSR